MKKNNKKNVRTLDVQKVKRVNKKKKLSLAIFSSALRAGELLDLLYTTIHQYIPMFYEKMESIPDHRKTPHYQMGEIIMAALGLFMFQMGSRNAMNQCREKAEYVENYMKVFGLNLPHMDTVNRVFQILDPSHLETLNQQLIKALLRKKIINKFRLFGEFFQVVIDGSGLGTVSEKYVNNELYKTSKSGDKTHFRYVVEAKLVAPNGFAISLASEFAENPEEFDKQDCEQKASKRLLEKLNHLYPQRKFCIQVDALYANAPFIEQVKSLKWKCIITLKEGSLPTLQKQWIDNMMQVENIDKFYLQTESDKDNLEYHWTNELTYQGLTVYGIMVYDLTDDNPIKFQYITTIPPTVNNIEALMNAARMRWKIENEGFQTQKIRGYAAMHKFSRKSPNASKNYYYALQIAHLINQLIEYSRTYMKIKGKTAKKHLQKILLGYMMFGKINLEDLQSLLNRKVQFIY